jgi:hypothetical protein
VGCILSPLRGWFLGGSSGAEKVPDKLDITSGAKAVFFFNGLTAPTLSLFAPQGRLRSGTRALPVREESRFFSAACKAGTSGNHVIAVLEALLHAKTPKTPTSGKGGQKWGTRGSCVQLL